MVWYVNSTKPTTIIKLSDKNTNWTAKQIANYHIVKELEKAGLVKWKNPIFSRTSLHKFHRTLLTRQLGRIARNGK